MTKTWDAYVKLLRRKKKKKKTSLFVYRWGAAAGGEESAGEFVGPPVTDRNWFCFLTLASPRWLAVHCLPGPFRPLGFPPFQGSSSVDDNTPRQAVWQCLNIPLLEQSAIAGTSWAALTCPANWQRKPPNIQEPSTTHRSHILTTISTVAWTM